MRVSPGVRGSPGVLPAVLAFRAGLGFPAVQAVLLPAGLLEFLAAAVLLAAWVVFRAEALLSAVLLEA